MSVIGNLSYASMSKVFVPPGNSRNTAVKTALSRRNEVISTPHSYTARAT